MDIEETRFIAVAARVKWNATGIRLTAGERYRFEADGTWTDRTTSCDPDGYESDKWLLRLTAGRRRAPREKWFALIGSVGCGREFFLIGRSATYVPRSSGDLFCFANDLSCMYRNNRGEVRLAVTRSA